MLSIGNQIQYNKAQFSHRIKEKIFKSISILLTIMAIEIMVRGKPMIINEDVIDRDIKLLEKQGKVGKYKNGVYQAPRPNIHGMLICLRDQRKYDPSQIEEVCMGVCPHPVRNNPIADDACHLDDCWKEGLFNGVSSDGKTKYVEYIE